MKTNKKTVLLLLNGLAISIGFKGNAMSTARPETFLSLWQKRFHVAALPSAARSTELFPETQYLSFLSGQSIETTQEIVEDEIKKRMLTKNKTIAELFEYSKRHNSSLHLIGIINKHDFSKQFDIFKDLLNFAASQALYGFRFHLILDNSWKDMTEVATQLAKLEKLVGHSRVGEISSITGESFVSDYMASDSEISKGYKSILLAKGRKFLSLNQCLSHLKKTAPSEVEPSSIVSNSRRPARINSFDSLFFFNYSNQKSSKFLMNFFSKRSLTVVDKNLRHLEIGVLAPIYFANNSEMKICFPFKKKTDLFDSIEKNNMKVRLYTEDYRQSLYRNVLGENLDHITYVQTPNNHPQYLQHYQKLTSEIVDKAIHDLTGEAELLVIDLPLIERFCDIGNFNEVVAAIKFIDSCILKLKDAILDHGSTMIVTSLYGMAESMDPQHYANNALSFCNLTHNALPFIVVDENKSYNQVHIIHEITRTQYLVSDFSRNILQIMGANTQNFPGKLFDKY